MKFKLGDFISELLLYSGQYALFYILMNFSKSGFEYFSYTAHTILILALLVQTLILYKYGNRIVVRLLGGLLCPFIYTLFEIHEFNDFILNMGHFFFWAFSLSLGIINALKMKSHKKTQLTLEFMTVFMNVIIFIFVYMYFDISLSQEAQATSLINEYDSALSILNIGTEMRLFFKDEAHIYLSLGGMLLGISLGLSQIKVVKLKEKINELFGTYIDKSIRDRLIQNDGVYEEKRELCILFCDIRSFTTLSETLEPSVIVKSLNQYFSLWEKISTQHKGVINKYIGDAIMLIFGLEDNQHDEEDAVQCGLQMLSALNELNTQLKEKHLAPFNQIGIGIHRGELIIGNIGGENRKELTVIGDVVNTASRLEAHTKVTGSDMVISRAVYDRLSDDLKGQFTFIDAIRLKGKENLMEAFKYSNS